MLRNVEFRKASADAFKVTFAEKLISFGYRYGPYSTSVVDSCTDYASLNRKVKYSCADRECLSVNPETDAEILRSLCKHTVGKASRNGILQRRRSDERKALGGCHKPSVEELVSRKLTRTGISRNYSQLSVGDRRVAEQE